jgi:tungstate transport system substrate-binding protein
VTRIGYARLASGASLGLVSLAVMACSPQPSTANTLDIATTSSVVNSGLLESLVPAFQKESGITVHVHAAGSGRALEMLNDQVVDLVISHAPQAESQMLAKHSDWEYQKIATNRFVVVGPDADPAKIRSATDAATAFKRIASSDVDFISRGDGSGTHERETDLWNLAQCKPAADRLLVSGTGMGATLRQADQRRAYTLSDDATFLQLRDQLALTVLFANDALLVNSYAVVYPRGNQRAPVLGQWLVRGKGRELIGAYSVRGTQPFTTWPDRCAGDQPMSRLCESP